MHVGNRAFVNIVFLSTWVFASQELEEKRNAKKHGQIKVKPYESVYSENAILPLMHLVLFSCIGKVAPGGCFAPFLSTKCMNNRIVELHRKISYCYVFPMNQNSPNGST